MDLGWARWEEWEHWRGTGSTEEEWSWVDQEEVVDVENNRELWVH